MKKLAGFLAFSLLSAGVITAQNGISAPATAINGNAVQAQLQSTDNAVATDGDIIIRDKRKKGQDLVDTQELNAAIQNVDNTVATDGDIIIRDKRKKGQDIVDTQELNVAIQNLDNTVATDGDIIIRDKRKKGEVA